MSVMNRGTGPLVLVHAVACTGVILTLILPNPLQVTAPASAILIMVVGVVDSASTPIRRSIARLSSTTLPREEVEFLKLFASTSVCVTYDSIILTVALLSLLHETPALFNNPGDHL